MPKTVKTQNPNPKLTPKPKPKTQNFNKLLNLLHLFKKKFFTLLFNNIFSINQYP